jgi:hypothetical protein
MKTFNFLLEDYKLKVEYYAGHLSRMWTRFNFLLTIDSALFGLFATGQVTLSPCWLFPVIGMALSVLWGVFGAFDLFFFTPLYRSHIESAYRLLVNETSGLPADYTYAGETPELRIPFRIVSPLYMSILMPVAFLGAWLYLWLTNAACP